jgi:N4-gp56 family major capsid protein
MTGQIWSVAAEGGYLYADELSDYLRVQAQGLCKFRQLADVKDGAAKGLNRGDTFRWNVYSNVGTQGRRLDERQAMPETGFTTIQHSLTVFEAGNSVPYTGKLELLAKHELVEIIDNSLRDDAKKYFDIEAHSQFKRTPLRVAPTGGNSATSVTLSTNSTAGGITNNVALGTGHVKAISDLMKERNIPAYKGDDYFAISHPSTYRAFKNQLETIKQYTSEGLGHIFAGEIGRYENTRFIEQNNVPKGGSNASTLFDPYSNTADPWTNGLSSWAYFFGGDTVTEAVCVPEEIRAKIPGDFGRSKAIAWYYLGGFGLVHDDAANARVLMWDSAA